MSNVNLIEDSGMATFHQLTATSLNGQPISMADYAGKLVLVVNTASHCGFKQASNGSIRSRPPRVWWCWVSPATSSVNRNLVEPMKSHKPVTSTTV